MCNFDNCKKDLHPFEIIMTKPTHSNEEAVVKWCPECGAIVVDLYCYGEKEPGHYKELEYPNITKKYGLESRNKKEINKEFNTKKELYAFLDKFDFDSVKDTEMSSVYFLVEYDNHIEPIFFAHYKDFWLAAPCALRQFPLDNNDVKKYVKDMYEAESWIEAYEFEKLMQKNGVHYEIDCPQCTPFLPEKIKIKEVFSDIKCLDWLLKNL